MDIINIKITIRQEIERGYPFELYMETTTTIKDENFQIPESLFFIQFKGYLRDLGLIKIDEYSSTHLFLLKNKCEELLDTTNAIKITDMGINNNAHIIIQLPKKLHDY